MHVLHKPRHIFIPLAEHTAHRPYLANWSRSCPFWNPRAWTTSPRCRRPSFPPLALAHHAVRTHSRVASKELRKRVTVVALNHVTQHAECSTTTSYHFASSDT